MSTRTRLKHRAAFTALGLLLAVLVSGTGGCSYSDTGGNGASAKSGTSSGATPIAASDPWTAVQLVKPADLAAQLADTSGEKPVLLHVGFKVLYKAGAIPGTRYLGPGSREDGIASLRAAVNDLPRDRAIVLYCGCCPWGDCPNMRPAFKAVSELGFTNVRALYITKNLDTDWVGEGYPVEKPGD